MLVCLLFFKKNGIPIANSLDPETRPRTTFVNNTTSLVTWKYGDESARILYQFVNNSGLFLLKQNPYLILMRFKLVPGLKEVLMVVYLFHGKT